MATNYTQEQVNTLSTRYRESAVSFKNQLLMQLQTLDPQDERYEARRIELTSLLYLTYRMTENASAYIYAGSPPVFSEQRIRQFSADLLQEPSYRELFEQNPFTVPARQEGDDDATYLEAIETELTPYRLSVDAAGGDTFIGEGEGQTRPVLSAQGVARRSRVLKDVLRNLEATGTGYYWGGKERRRNSESFENVKKELRRQIARMNAGFPIDATDDDRMIAVLNTYSERRRDTRNRGFGNVRSENVLRLYAEFTQHPAPRRLGDPDYPTPQSIARQFNRARGIDNPRYRNRENYVDLTAEKYNTVPGRTVRQQADEIIARLEAWHRDRQENNRALTPAEEGRLRVQMTRLHALHTIMLQDPAGAEAIPDEEQVFRMTGTVANQPALTEAYREAVRSYESMNEVIGAYRNAFRPELHEQYQANPDNFQDPVNDKLTVIGQPTFAERLRDAKNELRALTENGPVTDMAARQQIAQAAIRIAALQYMSQQGDVNPRTHISDERLQGVLSTIRRETGIERAIRNAAENENISGPFYETLTGDNGYDQVLGAVNRAARGSITNMLADAEMTFQEMAQGMEEELGRPLTDEEKQTAIDAIVHSAALNNLSAGEPYGSNRVFTERQVTREERRVRNDEAFMDGLIGSVTTRQSAVEVGTGLAATRYRETLQQTSQMLNRLRDTTEPALRAELIDDLKEQFAELIALRNLQIAGNNPNTPVTDEQLEDAMGQMRLGDAHLAIGRALDTDPENVADTLLNDTFSRPYENYQTAFAANVVPMIRRYPYPQAGTGTIGEVYDSITPLLSTDSDKILIGNDEKRMVLRELAINRLALRQLVLEVPEGAYAQYTPEMAIRLTEIANSIRQDPRYTATLDGMLETAQRANTVLTWLNRVVDLQTLKARQNRAQGREFEDPLSLMMGQLSPVAWLARSKAALEDARKNPGTDWTPAERDNVILAYARVHVLSDQLKKNPAWAGANLSGQALANTVAEYLARPGVRERLERVFSESEYATERSIASLKQQTRDHEYMADVDKMVRMMAIGNLEKNLFDDALLTEDEIGAEEQRIRQMESFRRLEGFLNDGHSLAEIAPAEEENYYDAMLQRSWELPGMEMTFEIRKNMLAEELRTMQQSGAPVTELQVKMAEIYLTMQYEQDGFAIDEMPQQAEIIRQAERLVQDPEGDFRKAADRLIRIPEEFDDFVSMVGSGSSVPQMTRFLNTAAGNERIEADPAEMREPNVHYEAQSLVMMEAAQDLINGNAGQVWSSDEERDQRRDEYIRFTAMNNALAKNPERVFLRPEEIEEGMEALRADENFMSMLNARLDYPYMLRFTVFNSAGVQRWSDATRMPEFRGMLENARNAENEGNALRFATVYGATTTYLAAAIEARISGRELSNETLQTRALNQAVSEVMYSERFRYIENAISANPREFDAVANLMKLPPADFQKAYEELTDRYKEEYPDFVDRDPNTVSASYNKARNAVKGLADEDPAAIAEDFLKRRELAEKIREVFMARRLVAKSPVHEQLMRRTVGHYENRNSAVTKSVEDAEKDAVDRLLGNLEEWLQNPETVKKYIDYVSGAGDIRELEAQDRLAEEIFEDPFVRGLREEGLAAPQPTSAERIQGVISQIRQAPAGEEPAAREERLRRQFAELFHEVLAKDLPEDELPSAAERQKKIDEIMAIPDFRTAVARIAKNPMDMSRILSAAEKGADAAQFSGMLDEQFRLQKKEEQPNRDMTTNLLYYVRVNTIEPTRNRLSEITTGQDMTGWAAGHKDVALATLIRFSAINKLMAENPKKAYFSNAEIDAEVKKFNQDKAFVKLLEDNARDGLHLRGTFFDMTGIHYWDQMKAAINYCNQAATNPRKLGAMAAPSWDLLASIHSLIVNDQIRGNIFVRRQEMDGVVEPYKESPEYQTVLAAIMQKPERLRNFLLEMTTLTPEEYAEKFEKFVDDIHKEMGVERQRYEFKRVKDKEVQEEAEQVQEQKEAEPAKKDAAEIIDDDPESYYNLTKQALADELEYDFPAPPNVRNGFAKLYMAGILREEGKEINEVNVLNDLKKLENDALFNKFLDKCLADPDYAKEQLKNGFANPDLNKIRGSIKSAFPGGPFEREREQFKWDLHRGRVDANYENRMFRMIAMMALGTGKAHSNAVIQAKMNELVKNPQLVNAIKAISSHIRVQGQDGQIHVREGYGLMIANTLFKDGNPNELGSRLQTVLNQRNVQATDDMYMRLYGPKPETIKLPVEGVRPNSPKGEFLKTLQQLDERMLDRQKKIANGGKPEMTEDEVAQFAKDLCKATALHKMAYDDKLKDLPVNKEMMQQEALRMKDDPDMQKTIQTIMKEPGAEKTLIEGMIRMQDNPQRLNRFVKAVDEEWKLAEEWMDATYPDPAPQLITSVYKPEPKFYGLPQIAGVDVQSNKTVRPPRDGSEYSNTYYEMQGTLNDTYESYKNAELEDKEELGEGLRENMARMFAVHQIHAGAKNPNELNNLAERIDQQAQKNLADPAFQKAVKLALDDPNVAGFDMVRTLTANLSYANTVNKIQDFADQQSCKENGIDYVTGKKIEKPQQQAEVQAEQGGAQVLQ